MRQSCAALTDQARLVAIDDERLVALAADLAGELAAQPAARDQPEPGPAPHPEVAASGGGPAGPDAVEAAVRRVVTLDAINFGSGYHDVIDKEPGRSGARTMAARLGRALDELDRQPPAAALDWMRALTPAGCAAVFGQSLDHPEQAELMGLFTTALGQLGDFVAERHAGSFASLVEAADRSARSLTAALLAMPFYQDRAPVPELPSLEVHFYKRAQITAADLARELPGWAPARFTDLSHLTAFADNLVPHVLRIDGVLRVDDAVVDDIDRGVLLPPGGRAELELRAAGVEAVERLTRAIGRGDVRAMDIDLALWERGGHPHYKAHRRHRTRGPFY
ncbi:MAG: queuosine salvage family protein [Actinomycetota bacterium]